MLMEASQFADRQLLELADVIDLRVPRGEPRKLVADAAGAFLTQAPVEERQRALEDAAAALWETDAKARVERAVQDEQLAALLEVPARESPLALALAYRAVLHQLARDDGVQAPLVELETAFAGLDAVDRDRFGPTLARTATPALPLDIPTMKDDGYYYVQVFPPEGSEGVDIVVVLDGRVLLEIDGSTPVVLDRGDSAYYDSTRRHRWSNIGPGDARILSIATPPTNL